MYQVRIFQRESAMNKVSNVADSNGSGPERSGQARACEDHGRAF